MNMHWKELVVGKRRSLVCAAALAVICAAAAPDASAQDYPKLEIFGGGSVVCAFCNESPGREGLGGWQASAAGNLNKTFGIVGDFGGQTRSSFGTRAWQYEYLFGPQFSARSDRLTDFAHALFGGASLHAAGGSVSGFAMGFGGGVDINLTKTLALRAAQFDYVRHRLSSAGISIWQNDIRLGVGVVFNLK
jgi:hypothetical protein